MWSSGHSAAHSYCARFGVAVPRDCNREGAAAAPRRLRGGSDQSGAGLGMVAGRAGAGQGSVRAGQAPLWAPARVNLLECMQFVVVCRKGVL